MGDHRAEIKLSFDIYNSKFSTEMSINYDTDGFDHRIQEWFESHYNEARAEWEAVIYKEERERIKKHELEDRRRLFLELKKEFEEGKE